MDERTAYPDSSRRSEQLSCTKYFHPSYGLKDMKGSLGAVVKLLPCDHEVMGSSPGNSLLQKCRERLRTIDPKWSDPSLDPAQAGATCTGAALLSCNC